MCSPVDGEVTRRGDIGLRWPPLGERGATDVMEGGGGVRGSFHPEKQVRLAVASRTQSDRETNL